MCFSKETPKNFGWEDSFTYWIKYNFILCFFSLIKDWGKKSLFVSYYLSNNVLLLAWKGFDIGENES